MKPENKGVRPEKASMFAELEERVSGAVYMIVADYTGMNMPQTVELKKSLRENDATFNVAGNRMLNLVLDVDASGLLKGQNAMICGSGDVVEVAKIVKKFSKKNAKPVIKGGLLEGKVISAEEVQQLAELPPKQVLQAQLLGTLNAPAQQLASVLNQKVSSIVYVLEAARAKKEEA
jgi:large subunit ribosomal protein L10